MSIRYQCVECGASMKIKAEKAGTKGHCPQCKVEFIVPGVAAEAETDAAVDESPSEDKEKTKASDEGDRDDYSTAPVSKKSKPTAEETEASLEDELQAVLMGGGDDAPRSRPKPADSDMYLTSTLDAPPDSNDEIPASPRKERNTPAPKPKGPTTAEISASLMRRNKGGDSGSFDSDSGVQNKKTGKSFGDVSDDSVARRKKNAAEARVYYTRQLAILGVLAVLVLAIGYWATRPSRGKLPNLARVSGTVKLNGAPLAGARVTFHPVIEGGAAGKSQNQLSSSMGVTDAMGNYQLYYIQDVQGAVVGKHIVMINAQSPVGLEIVPDRFNVNSTLGYEVKAGSNADANFDVADQ